MYDTERSVREQIAGGVWFTSITDPKFKHNRISVNLALPLSSQTAAEYAIVPYLLRKGCQAYPNISSLNSRLAELYGAYLDGELRKSGANQILNLSVQGLDSPFCAGKGGHDHRMCPASLSGFVCAQTDQGRMGRCFSRKI